MLSLPHAYLVSDIYGISHDKKEFQELGVGIHGVFLSAISEFFELFSRSHILFQPCGDVLLGCH